VILVRVVGGRTERVTEGLFWLLPLTDDYQEGNVSNFTNQNKIWAPECQPVRILFIASSYILGQNL
jgi:hypothetical protein